jgi:hypothetical protein
MAVINISTIYLIKILCIGSKLRLASDSGVARNLAWGVQLDYFGLKALLI